MCLIFRYWDSGYKKYWLLSTITIFYDYFPGVYKDPKDQDDDLQP